MKTSTSTNTTSTNTDVLIGFGANLGSPESMYRRVTEAFAERFPVRASRLYRTAAVGFDSSAPDYRNGVLRLNVGPEWTPRALLDLLLRWEADFGRVRDGIPWSPRSVDLDLLLYGECVLADPPRLVLPHPLIPWRKFVLEPASEVASDMVHPAVGLTLEALKRRLDAYIPVPVTISDFLSDPQNVPPGAFLIDDSPVPLPESVLLLARSRQVPILSARLLFVGLFFVLC